MPVLWRACLIVVLSIDVSTRATDLCSSSVGVLTASLIMVSSPDLKLWVDSHVLVGRQLYHSSCYTGFHADIRLKGAENKYLMHFPEFYAYNKYKTSISFYLYHFIVGKS
ncbi:hypothetical protein XENOCAPTIV_001512 [Xenoophorus captivus]|uniref:Secreted protein n=1 Tax=Xenoophorus captivus TaxID=1517983 RepID=A0ABV0R665_9TELE